ncbi:two-component regulator propeller domain-containing protein [Spirosoma soli]|uniref:Oxygen sensor histidine kinase NreB n=1 Tax=Spirosoma soli TaxID=1770529 RepID=A0ABW5M9M3_9BACT
MRTVLNLFTLILSMIAPTTGMWAQAAYTSNASAFRVDHIGVGEGLTQGSVYYMLKDSRGFLWFGTQDGLNRYDGHHFRTYRPTVGERGAVQPGSIRGVNIFGIIEDPEGNLWIGTEEGLNRYDRRHDRFDCFFAIDSNGKPVSSRTLPFFVNKTELLYLSDAEGLVRFEYKNRHKTVLASSLHPTKEYDLQSSTVRTVSDDIWLHAPTGLMRYNLRDRTLSHYFSNHPQNQVGAVQAVFSFYIDADNIAWLGTSAGLIRFDYHQKTYQTYETAGANAVSAIYSLAPDQRGRLWLGTQHDGVLYFDKRSRMFGQVNGFTNKSRRLNEFKISKVYVDDMGIIWANADPDGLARIIPDVFLFGGITKRQTADTESADRKLSSYTIRGFMEERFDRLWLITENGIDVLNPRTDRIVERHLTDRRSNLPGNNLLKSIYRDPQRRIWVGTSDGVLAFDEKTKTFKPILFSSPTSLVADNYARNLISVADTTLVAATEDGLYSLNTRQQRWSKLSFLSGLNIFSLWYDDPTRQLWVGTYLNGYYCYQLSPQTTRSNIASWRLIKSGLKGYTVLHIRPDANRKTMWLSCDRGLVALKPRTGRFTLYTERQGMANSFVYGSVTDVQNNIWMSTNRGILRLDPKTQTVKNFTLNDGLQGYEFNGNAFLRTANGELYFGGVNGFNRFRPDLFHSSLHNPYVHIYTLNVNEEPYKADTYVGETNRIELDYNQNTVSLEFAALDYFSNGNNAYQYQLKGYDDRWVAAGQRNYVRYANLPPGEYTFEVKAANLDGHWSNRIRRLHIEVKPPFWRRLPFLVIITLLLAVAALTWVRQRERAIRHQEADRLRLAYDIQEQVKKDIARDLHDEIGTRLATIKLYTSQLTQQAGETPTILSLRTTIFNLINDTISDVRNLLRKLNPQTLEQHGYVAAVEELFSRINASGIIHTQLIISNTAGAIETNLSATSSRFSADTELMLYRITQELVSNSLKHAEAQQLELHLLQQPDRLVLTYYDNGRGFDYERIKKGGTGLGIGNIESRVDILNGRITWQSQPGHGVRATIEIPIGPVGRRSFYGVLTNQSTSN